MNKIKGTNKIKQLVDGLKVLTGVKPFTRGDKNLAVAANLFQTLIGIAGVGVVRGQAIKAIEKMLEERIKKNPLAKADDLLGPILSTPDFMDLLKVLDLGETDLRFFADEALNKWGKKNDQS